MTQQLHGRLNILVYVTGPSATQNIPFRVIWLNCEDFSSLLSEMLYWIWFSWFYLAFSLFVDIQLLRIYLVHLPRTSPLVTKEDTLNSPISQVDLAIPFIALPCQHIYVIYLCTFAYLLDQDSVVTCLPHICSVNNCMWLHILEIIVVPCIWSYTRQKWWYWWWMRRRIQSSVI